MDPNQSEFNKGDWIRMIDTYESKEGTAYQSAIGKIRRADPPTHAQIEFENGVEMTVPSEYFEVL